MSEAKYRLKPKFESLLKWVFGDAGRPFNGLEQLKNVVDRERILKIFYEISDKVLELDLTDFNPLLIDEGKRLRGASYKHILIR